MDVASEEGGELIRRLEFVEEAERRRRSLFTCSRPTGGLGRAKPAGWLVASQYQLGENVNRDSGRLWRRRGVHFEGIESGNVDREGGMRLEVVRKVHGLEEDGNKVVFAAFGRRSTCILFLFWPGLGNSREKHLRTNVSRLRDLTVFKTLCIQH